MIRVLKSLYRDDAGFIVSAELVLVATITVLGLIVGLSEVSLNVNNELEDVGSAFASVTQSFSYSGACGHAGHFGGSQFCDQADQCDGQFDINCDHSSSGEKCR
jgi:hypothetical protein